MSELTICSTEHIKDKKFQDLSNKWFGRWYIVGYAGKLKNNNNYWWCQCSCDEATIKTIRTSALLSEE
jgi:hypothetical protein